MKIQDVLNSVIHGDCLNVMKQFPDESVDLVVTSPLIICEQVRERE